MLGEAGSVLCDFYCEGVINYSSWKCSCADATGIGKT